MAKLKHQIHLISLTHWGREWRFPFEETRMLLVEMMDALLDLLEADADCKHYHLDGRSILLDDCLQARPENRQRLVKHVRDGRILIGPGYTLAAVSMVGGESLVRNLLMGKKVCEDFGARMAVGYTPAGYGRPSQMPQVFRNFGIDSAMFYRGISRHVRPSAEYWWEGPDGSRVLGFRLGDYARANFFCFVFSPVVHERDNRISPPKLMLGALKRSEDAGAAVCRPANPEDRAIDTTITLDRPVESARAVPADEETPAEGIATENGGRTIRLNIAAKKIVTSRLACA